MDQTAELKAALKRRDDCKARLEALGWIDAEIRGWLGKATGRGEDMRLEHIPEPQAATGGSPHPLWKAVVHLEELCPLLGPPLPGGSMRKRHVLPRTAQRRWRNLLQAARGKIPAVEGALAGRRLLEWVLAEIGLEQRRAAAPIVIGGKKAVKKASPEPVKTCDDSAGN